MNTNSVQCCGHKMRCWWDCCGYYNATCCKYTIDLYLLQVQTTNNASCYVCNKTWIATHVYVYSVIIQQMTDIHICMEHCTSDVLCKWQVVAMATPEFATRTYLLCACIIVWHCCMLIHMYVLPVLKHGPRSLMYVRVHGSDRTMRNICDHKYSLMNCRRICLNKSECEHMH